jgi:hypothetical protein
MKRLYAFAGAVCVLAGAGLFAAPAVHAEDQGPAVVTDVAWWNATPGTAEPDGGFQVSQDSQGGATAVAAIRMKVSVKSLSSALFVFTEGPTKLSEASADIRLCKGSNDWTPANPGALSSAPKYDCAKSVQLKRSQTLLSWSGDAGALITGPGVVTIMVVPGEQHNGSVPTPSYDNLPHVNLPVATPVGIPPPLPIDPRSPDPAGPVLATADCPPGFYDITEGLGSPQQCIGLPTDMVPATPIPFDMVPIPGTLDFPFPIGFQVEMTSTQLSAAAQDDSSFGDLSDLSASGGLSDSGVFSTAPGVLGGELNAGLPLSEAGAAALEAAGGTATPNGVQLASSGKGRPWGRIWLLAVVAMAVGAGSAWARRQTAAMGL